MLMHSVTLLLRIGHPKLRSTREESVPTSIRRKRKRNRCNLRFVSDGNFPAMKTRSSGRRGSAKIRDASAISHGVNGELFFLSENAGKHDCFSLRGGEHLLKMRVPDGVNCPSTRCHEGNAYRPISFIPTSVLHQTDIKIG
ncbi:hypothetical protein EVAR_17340_1 [Eumeta japonica]|uniref:Uncharacterized protein n=1 Tax=Eumeta variegata TaxID=151549 RepID=A0A4C1SQY7_EUMVA|nr:hypothetical protein EVAR_17340_1 [Eumeta japonica]